MIAVGAMTNLAGQLLQGKVLILLRSWFH